MRRRRYLQSKQRVLDQQREYYTVHREEIRAAQRTYYETHREYAREYYWRDRAKMLEYGRNARSLEHVLNFGRNLK